MLSVNLNFAWHECLESFFQYEHCVVVSLTQTKKKGLNLKKKLVEDVSVVTYQIIHIF